MSRARLGRAAAALLETEERWSDERVEVIAGYSGPAYGVPDSSTLEAIALAAGLEALVLDPVYSGKGLAGLIGLVHPYACGSEEPLHDVGSGPSLVAIRVRRAGAAGARSRRPDPAQVRKFECSNGFQDAC
jgi:L-cysteate sulfo-lyase